MKNKWFIKVLPGGVVLLARVFFLGVLVLVPAVSGYAKVYEEGEFPKNSEQPRSFSLYDESQEQIKPNILKQINIEQLLAEDQAREKDSKIPVPLRFAVTADVAAFTFDSGTWQTLPDGRLWRLRIQSPGAMSLNLGITRFDMPEGAKLWIYDPGHAQVQGPYTARHRSSLGRLWTPIIEGDEIVVEVFVPTGVAKPVVEIGQVNQGYRSFGLKSLQPHPVLGTKPSTAIGSPHSKALSGSRISPLLQPPPVLGPEASCNQDVKCEEVNWPLQKSAVSAVGLLTFSDTSGVQCNPAATGPCGCINGTCACTGTLLNNTNQDNKPYFLSAFHCGIYGKDRGTLQNDDTVVVYWNFQSPVCSTSHTAPSGIYQTTSGSTYRAGWNTSDFLLLELCANPAQCSTPQRPNANPPVFYAGWDASGAQPTATAGIHHPKGDVKAISISSTQPTAKDNSWLVVFDNGKGITQKGSSGSCIFDNINKKRCIGQLQGGGDSVAHPDPCVREDSIMPRQYHMLSASWTGGGTPCTSLKEWLDPQAHGATLFNDGDPHITTANGKHYNFQGAGEYVVLRDHNGKEIQTRQAPIATTFNPGPDPHDSLATCVSLNTAVASRVGEHRVTYEPNLSGVPDPGGLQLRVDGVLTTLDPTGLDLVGGGRIAKTSVPGGLQIDFPDASVLFVTPGWWADQRKWYLNVDIERPSAMDGTSGDGDLPTASDIASILSERGLMGIIPQNSWLPVLPDGTSLGPMPDSLHQRYVALYQKFGDAWRVTDKTSLFDYAPGTSTDTFTMRDWPLEHPPCAIQDTIPVQPTSELVAKTACRPINDKNMRANCIFDVRVTGNTGFAQTYLHTQQLQPGATAITVKDDRNPTQYGENATFTATVAQTASRGGGRPVMFSSSLTAAMQATPSRSIRMAERCGAHRASKSASIWSRPTIFRALAVRLWPVAARMRATRL